VGWFDIAETPDGRSYSVAAYRAGTSPAITGGIPGAVPAVLRLLLIPYLLIVGIVVRILARIRLQHAWTVRVGPWYGHRGKRWKVRVPTESDSDRRANALFELIKTGQWDPELEPPPAPARTE
jgi:hypothetical protein